MYAGPISASIGCGYKDLTINVEQVRLKKCLRVNPHVNSPQAEKWTQKDGWCKVCKDYTEAHLNTSRTKRWDLGMNYLHVQKNIMTNAQLKHAQLIPSNYAVQLFPLGLVPAGLQI